MCFHVNLHLIPKHLLLIISLRPQVLQNCYWHSMKTLFNYIVYESTPQSKKMKREDENGRGADDESDNEDDNGMTCMTQLCAYVCAYTDKYNSRTGS